MRFSTVLLPLLALAFVLTPPVQAQLLDTPVWQITPADVTWLGTASTVRGGVINPATGNLLIPSREGGISVQVLNPATGAVIGQLNVTGISGGTFAINKIAATSDGQIFASNLVTDASGSNFKIYRWADQASNPAVVFDGALTAHRYGDSFNVSGSGANVVAYASGTAPNPNLAVFTMGATTFSAPTYLTLPAAGAAQTGIAKAAGQDSLWINAPAQPVRKISTATGAGRTVISTTDAHSQLTELTEFTVPQGFTYLAVGPGRHDGTINESRVLVFDVTDLGNIVKVAETHRWGTNDNRFAPGGFVTYDAANHFLIAGVTQNAIQAFDLDGSGVIPVELVSFEGVWDNDQVRLNWSTASETNNAGFEVMRRSILSAGDFGAWEALSFVQGYGTTATAQEYTFVDAGVPFTANRVQYRLRQVDTDGTSEYSGEIELDASVPTALRLHPAFPNPIRTSATLRFELPSEGAVSITLYDMLGRTVQHLVNRDMEAGRHQVSLDAQGLAAGVYIVRMSTADRAETQRLTIVQ
jgi:hypothetical protein